MNSAMDKSIEMCDLAAQRTARSAPDDVGDLIVLAQHLNPVVRRLVVENQLTPRIALHLLCRDRYPEVLSAAENPSTPSFSVMALLDDESSDLRYALAENHNLPVSITSRLCNDENPYVACRAQKTMCRRSSLSTVHEIQVPGPQHRMLFS